MCRYLEDGGGGGLDDALLFKSTAEICSYYN